MKKDHPPIEFDSPVAHKMHHEHVKQHSGGFAHHNEMFKKHGAGHMYEQDKVQKMCGGGMAGKK
jgi:hypothetical protein